MAKKNGNGTKENTWQNRITGYGTKPASQFQANPLNFRKHPQHQRDALAASLRELGWVGVVIENQRTGSLVDGHERIWQAMANGDADVPFITVDLSPEEERLALATYDPISALATTDKEQLAALLDGVNTGEAALQQMLSELAEKSGLDWGAEKPDAPEPEIDRAAELQVKWGTELGQMWTLGDHRLVCGDCTEKAVVERVMGGEKAQAVVTDPPYGINREGIENDNPEGLRALFDGCLAAMPIENAVVIAFQSPRLFPVWLDASRATGQKFERALWFYDETDVTFPWRGWLMTSQIALVSSVGRAEWGKGEYHHDCYIVKTAGKQDDSGGHTTAKPLDVIENLVEHTMGTVYEPFSGSGTTIVACERLGRKCRAVEISPAYVAVALERLSQMGLQPELIEAS